MITATKKVRLLRTRHVLITSTNSVPNRPSSSPLRAKSTSSFDEWGRAYLRETFSVDPSTGSVSSNSLKSKTWFDKRGNAIKTEQPGGLIHKSVFDGVGRTIKNYLTDGGGDSGWSDADDVAGDIVLSQSEMTYDSNSNVLMGTSKERFHDESGTGELGTASSGVKARVSSNTSYYDLADRLIHSVHVGTNGGSAYTRPTTVPTRSDTILIHSQTYNAAGWVDSSTDPRGLVGKTFTSAGDVINNHDIPKETRHPDPTTGSASASQKEIGTTNGLGETITMTDRNGNVHTYSRDILGRITADAVTTLGSGVDGSVRRIETAYDTQGNAYLFTSYDASSGGNIVNQVQRGFNGLGQLTVEYQSHSGAAPSASHPKSNTPIRR